MMSSSWTPHHLHGPRLRACSTQESSTRLSKDICALMVCCRCGIRKAMAMQRCLTQLQRRGKNPSPTYMPTMPLMIYVVSLLDAYNSTLAHRSYTSERVYDNRRRL